MSANSVKLLSKDKSGMFHVPPEMQGFTFGGDDGTELTGPFRVEYVLCSDFMIYLDDLQPFNLAEGFSNVKLSGQLSMANYIKMPYHNGTDEFNADIILVVNAKDGYLQRLVVTNLPQDLSAALTVANICVSSILDSICFRKHTPLQIRNVCVYDVNSGDGKAIFFTVPYFPVNLEEKTDLSTSYDMPNKFRPLLRLFREAINSTSPYYRLLCLYRINEGLDEIRGEHSKIIKSVGGDLHRQPVMVPDDQITRYLFPDYAGKKVGKFISYVYDNYRVPIAHYSFDKYETILSPAHSKTCHVIDAVNYVLFAVIPEMINIELDFMRTNNLT